MATSTRKQLGVRNLAGSYPTTLPERLAWLEEGLGLDRQRVLKLAGISRSMPPDERMQDWSNLAEEEPTLLEQTEETLFAFVSQFCNDLPSARKFLDQARHDSEYGTKHLPFLSRFSTPSEKDAALLGMIHEGGPDFVVAFATFFASAE